MFSGLTGLQTSRPSSNFSNLDSSRPTSTAPSSWLGTPDAPVASGPLRIESATSLTSTPLQIQFETIGKLKELINTQITLGQTEITDNFYSGDIYKSQGSEVQFRFITNFHCKENVSERILGNIVWSNFRLIIDQKYSVIIKDIKEIAHSRGIVINFEQPEEINVPRNGIEITENNLQKIMAIPKFKPVPKEVKKLAESADTNTIITPHWTIEDYSEN